MNFRNLVLTAACGMAFSSGAFAQGACRQYMASGTYLATLTGSATVATTPLPVFAPVVGVGMATLDDNGSFSGPLVNSVAGAASTDVVTGKVTVNADCTVTFTASCQNGCSWQGAGFFLKAAKEINVVITKAVGYPLTASVVLKQLN